LYKAIYAALVLGGIASGIAAYCAFSDAMDAIGTWPEVAQCAAAPSVWDIPSDIAPQCAIVGFQKWINGVGDSLNWCPPHGQAETLGDVVWGIEHVAAWFCLIGTFIGAFCFYVIWCAFLGSVRGFGGNSAPVTV
jgi:hypothetical protein